MDRWEERVGLIGAGRLGTSLAAAMRSAGIDVVNIDPRTQTDWAESAEDCLSIFLTVADRDIRALAEAVPWRPGQAAIHCSGTLGLDVLERVRKAGGLAGCLHPLQSFPSQRAEPWRFNEIWCGSEGDGGLQEALEALTTSLGAHSFGLRGVDRVLYHAAAVTMNNLVVGLAAVAAQLWEAAGLRGEDARPALNPLLRSAANNIGALPLAEALTGPIARGDVATVRAHLEALEHTPAIREIYRGLSLQLLELVPGASNEQLAGLLRTSPSP